MGNIIVRSQSGGEKRPARAFEWDPFAIARDMLRFDPFREMIPTLPAIEPMGFNAAFEVRETRDAYLFKADVPGILEKDVEVTLTGNRLTINGKREAEKEDKSDTVYAYERSYGAFTRSFTLPDGIDGAHVRAELKEGVLTVAVPKTPEAKPQKIALTSPEKKS